MPRHREHLRACRALLGHATPALHQLMDLGAKEYGWGHRLKNHDAGFYRMVKAMYGEELALEVLVHLLQDLGLIRAEHLPTRRARPGAQLRPAGDLEAS